MGRTWTPAQEAAIQTRDCTLLISAAAGSGKTATLTERIIRRLTDPEAPMDLSRLLVVTFTRAAAAELRERIGKALSEAIARDPANGHLRRQLLRLGSAHISTIDSFVREPVMAHFAELGLSPKTRIADEAELLPLSERVMGELMEEFYCKYASYSGEGLFSLLTSNPFADLCDSLTPSKNDAALLPTIRSLYERLLAFPAGIERLNAEADELERGADGDFFATAHGTLLREWLSDFCTSAECTLAHAWQVIEGNEAAARAYGNAFAYDLDFVRRLAQVTSYTEAYTYFMAYEKPRLGALRGASEDMVACKEARAAVCDHIKALAKTYFADAPEVVAAQMRDTARMCRVLCDFLLSYDQRILAEKRERGICDFTDNRRYLLCLLRDPTGEPTPAARELAARYDEVYIDEYQDVDELQDEIFRLVGGNHRFMVGDLKQSIYGFRGADPSVFARYRQTLPSLDADMENPGGKSIFMSDNFRCDESVIRVTNAVCGHILRACPHSVGYRPDDDLGFAKRPPHDGYRPTPVEVTVLKKPGRADAEEEDAADNEHGGLSAVEAEATYVANRIASLLRAGETLANGERIRPKDIAILMRAGTSLRVYREALAAMGIPTGSDELDAAEAGRDILHGTDMMYLLNLLRVIDDPDHDIPLAELLRAPFPGFTLEEVLILRRAEDPATAAYSLFECLETYADSAEAEPSLCVRVNGFLTWIEHYRALCATQSAAGLLRLLSRDERCAGRETDAFRYLYDAARTCRSGAFVSLFVFLRFFEKKLLTTKNAVSATAAEGDEGHVSLMTIHKSKGLEFPVCFIVRAGQTFSPLSASQDLIFEKRTGLSVKLYCRGGNSLSHIGNMQSQAKYDTTLRNVGALAVRLSEREEEMRVLYVAMTRARERLYIVGVGSAAMDTGKRIGFAEGDRHATLSCSHYLRWVLAGLEAHPEVSDFCQIRYVSTTDITPAVPLSVRTVTADGDEPDENAARFRRISACRNQPTRMELLLGQIPTKIPASCMRDDLLDSCVFYDTDRPADADGERTDTDNGVWCDAVSEAAIREALALMSTRDASGTNEFELLLGDCRRPTAAERGTAAHLFLQYADYDRMARDGLDEEIARLSEQGFINARTAEVLDKKALQAFFDSRFMVHIRQAATVERELKFHRFIPLSDLTSDAALAEALGNRMLYVQGSIDLLAIFPDGHIELCDYKTDRISPAERADLPLLTERMTARHAEQLKQYAAAVEEIYGIRPTKTYIFSLPLGEAIEIDLG